MRRRKSHRWPSQRPYRAITAAATLAALVGVGTVASPSHAVSLAGPGVVYGIVVDGDGNPVSGADVQLELEPSAGYRTAGGAQIHLLGRTVTGTGGIFGITVPTTDDVLAEADYLNGTVNMMLNVVLQTMQDGIWHTEVGLGGIYSQLVEFGSPNGAGALALAPVNVGVVTINDVTSLAGVGGLPDTPSDDPDDPTTQPDPVGSQTLPAGTGAVPAAIPYEEPYIDTPPAAMWSDVVETPPLLTEWPALPHPEDPPYADPDDRCYKGYNQGTWLVDRLDSEYRWQPIGEVHSVPGLKVRYHYEERAMTTLGMGVRADLGPWKISGGTSMANDSSGATTMPWMPNTFARHVEGEFFYVHNRKTWCPEGYDPASGRYATHTEEIKSLSWQGGLQYSSSDISGADSRDNRDKAVGEGRAGTLLPGSAFIRTKGKTYKYTAGVSAFGVGLNAVSTNDIKHTMELVAGTGSPGESWHMWGDKAAPPSATNHAVYVY